MSDFITCVCITIRKCFEHEFPPIRSLMDTAMFSSLLSIFSIAIDRYLLTVHPFKHRVLLNRRRIAIWIASIWLISFCLLARYLAFRLKKIDQIIYDTMFIVTALITSLIYILTYCSLKKQGRIILQSLTETILTREFCENDYGHGIYTIFYSSASKCLCFDVWLVDERFFSC